VPGKRRLTIEQVRYVLEVYDLRKSIPTYDALAKQYGITEPSIHRILSDSFNPETTRLPLATDDIKRIRELGLRRKKLPTLAKIARQWGVSPSTLFDAVNGQTYKEVV
jgi:AraC-like DNA-binding protein